MSRKPAPATTDTTQDLPGVSPAPAPENDGAAVVAPAAVAQGRAPKKDRNLSPAALLGVLAKIISKTEVNSPEFLVVLDAMGAVRKLATASV